MLVADVSINREAKHGLALGIGSSRLSASQGPPRLGTATACNLVMREL